MRIIIIFEKLRLDPFTNENNFITFLISKSLYLLLSLYLILFDHYEKLSLFLSRLFSIK